MTPPTLTVTTEQVNSLPLLLGILTDMGMRDIIDTQLPAHGNWEGVSIGTLLSIWLCHILQERDHTMVRLRDWAAERSQTLNHLLAVSWRDTDATDDRLARLLTLLGDPATQAALDQALLSRWLRIYHLPTDTLRLDTTTVSVYHDDLDQTSLLQHGWSKDHRPDLRQLKLMLATLDPLGLPIACQTVAGHRSDTPLYIPAYDAAVKALGTTNVLVVGDSKMTDMATRAHIVARGSCYLGAYRPARASALLAEWVETALANAQDWIRIETLDTSSGEIHTTSVIHTFQHGHIWQDAQTEQVVSWNERVLVVRASAYQDGQQRQWVNTLERLTEGLEKLAQPPTRGRKRYASEAALAEVVASRLAAADLEGVVQTRLEALEQPDGTSAWVVAAIWVELAGWQALVERLGWQVYVTNTTAEQYSVEGLVAAYHQQPVLERSFSRLKTRNLHIRPVYVRDETRLAGLVWVLCQAVRVLVLTEQRLREALTAAGGAIAGLNPASRTQATSTPTTERVIRAFRNLTVTIVSGEGWQQHHVSSLNETQQHILACLELPADLYARLGQPSGNFALQMRE